MKTVSLIVFIREILPMKQLLIQMKREQALPLKNMRMLLITLKKNIICRLNLRENLTLCSHMYISCGEMIL